VGLANLSGPEEGGGILHRGLGGGGGPILGGDGLEHFAAMNLDTARSIDAQADTILGDAEDKDLNLATNDDGLLWLSGDDEHEGGYRGGSVLYEDRETQRIAVGIENDLASLQTLHIHH